MPLSTSVILCTYNGARFLRAQWDSLLAQARLPDEIVVRDDASTDATYATLEGLACEAEAFGVRVHLTRNASNLGYVANFGAALVDASGDVVFLCDQDDTWHPDKLVMLASEFERRTELLLLCTDACRINIAGAGLRHSLFEVLRVSRSELQRMHTGRGFDVLLRRSLATGATIALRRRLLADALPIPAGWVHDEWLAIIAAALGGFDGVERRLIDYRQHAGNQIGMPDRDLATKWRDLVKPRATMIDMLIARDTVLQERLRALGARVPDASRERVAEKLGHLRARQALRGAPWARAGSVLREMACGRYQRYASGWRSAFRDLVRRGA
ncbi:MAG: glycosyltransferase family 2 protein [Xanthomonadales bacterium]|mgnify:CR=1 FL=1|nr:glycosyltransferase family 2 protein [Xanthomonadales bacterium]ODU91570.1 MAG: hypothetical protein ABT18_15455 [Rhodanobacter sp. SCN 66-43]OJY85978.1 MAG: hypothetical protein BGP23_04780 [Xanthomonadales bacterium 66-474]